MKTAFSSWNNRIAPVFDVTRRVFLVESDNGRIIQEAEKGLPGDDPGEKALHLAGLGVNSLVCGAISRFMQGLVASYGITVVPFVSGDLREVIRAWLEGRIDDACFAMPGCCPRNGRRHGGMGIGRSRGRRTMSDDPGAGAAGVCFCPQCSHSEPHERGVPCSRKHCPVCGNLLVRGSSTGGMRVKDEDQGS